MLIFINGKYYKEHEACISVLDHGLLYGDGVFEGIRIYEGKVFCLREHLKRLYDSAQALILNISMTIDEMQEAVLETVRVNKLQNGYIRLIATRGVGDLGLNPYNCKRALIIIIADKIQLYPEKLYERGLEVVTVATKRNIPEALDPNIKSLNYLNNIMAKVEAIRSNVQEAIMLNYQGYVAECTGDNIFIISKNKLITPPSWVGALNGITRQVVIELAEKKLKLKVREDVFTRYHVYTADECFLTGTAAEVIPVVRVDNRNIGSGKPGHITLRLIKEFRKLTKSTGVPVYKR
ncbi:MAG: branched-chain-amino-acid transaminase [bacterium]